MSIETNIIDSDKSFCGFVNALFVKKQINLLVVIFVLFLAYGLKFTYISINNDQPMAIYGNLIGLFKQGRWGSLFTRWILVSERNVPLWSDVIGLILLIFSASFLAYFWWIEFNYQFSDKSLLVFILLFCTYPLSMSFYAYPTAITDTAIYYIFISCSLVLWHKMILNGFSFRLFGLGIFLGSIAISGYESFASVFLLAIILSFFNNFHNKKNITYLSIVKKAIFPCLYLVSACLLYFLIQKLTIFIYNGFSGFELPDNEGAERTIVWFIEEVKNSSWLSRILNFSFFFFYDYIYSSIFNFGLLVFWTTVIVAIVLIIQGKRDVIAPKLLLLFFAILSIFSLSIIMGKPQPYRTCQAIPIFIGFIWMVVLQKYMNHKYSNIFWGIVMVILLLQTKECSLFFSYDKKISKKYENRYYSIGQDINKCSFYNGQKVLFIGNFVEVMPVEASMTLPIFKTLPKRTIPVFQGSGLGAMNSRYGKVSALMQYFNNIEVKWIDKEDREKWEQRVKDENQPCWPHEGYIRQYSDEIVINLGFPEPNPDSGKRIFINDWKKILFSIRKK